MRYQYVVILKRTNDRIIDRISLLLCFFSGASFLLAQIQARHFNFFLLSAALVILTGSFATWGMSRRYRRGDPADKAPVQPSRDKADPPLHPNKRVRYRYWLLTAALGWLGMPQLQWLSVLFVLLTFLEYQAKYPLEIGFSTDRIVINSLLRKRFNWSAFSNIKLKDGLLTLDFKNNRLLQKEVDEEEEGEAEEDEFNDYCRDRLNAAMAHAQRQADGKPE